MTKISAVIITFNEEKNIGRCLESLNGIVDEIVIVDSFSTDVLVGSNPSLVSSIGSERSISVTEYPCSSGDLVVV